jgi:hypothetical protein
MARKPIQLERSGMLTQRERLWAAARKLRRFTLMQWQDATKPVVRLQTCKTYLASLVRSGHLVQDGEEQANRGFPQTCYRIAKDTLDAPRVTREGKPVTQGQTTLAMWRAMQVLKSFDWHDVQRAASLPAAPVPAETAKSYVAALARAGYFLQLQPAKPGTAARYRLVRKTGAHPPAITRRKTVFDRNTGEFTWQESAQEVVDGIE